MIKTYNLNKFYGKKQVLKDVNLQFHQGKIYGLLGRNAAGKTTLVNIITNRVFATSGSVEIDGMRAYENDFAQQKVFCITEKSAYPASETVKNLFSWAARFYPSFDHNYAVELATKFDLEIEKKLGRLSTGYTTIAKVILTLASNVPYMIFDEPVLGIDAIYREVFYEELIKVHKKLNNCMILATHILDESERVLDEVIVLREGRVVQTSQVSQITASQSLQEFYLELHKTSLHQEAGGVQVPTFSTETGQSSVSLGRHNGSIDTKKIRHSIRYLMYITWMHALIITALCVVFTIIPLAAKDVEMSIEATVLLNVMILAINVQGFYFKYAMYNGVSRRTYILSVILVLITYAFWFALLSCITITTHNLAGYQKGIFQAFYTTKLDMWVFVSMFVWLFMGCLFAMSLGFFAMVLYQTLSRKGKYITMSILMLIVVILILWSTLAPPSYAPIQVLLFTLGLKHPSHGIWFSTMWLVILGVIFSTISWLILKRIEVK